MKKLSLALLLVLIMIGPVIVPGNPVKAATGGYGTVNLAKGKPVTATTNTVRGNPSDVNDGNIDTVWYSFQGNPTNNSFVLDLGAVYSIGRIDITLAQAWGFTVSTSIDGANYTQRHTSPWSPTTVSAPVSIAVDGAYTARYIKYSGYANWSQYVGVQEIEIYEWLPSPTPSAPGISGTVNLALNRPTALQSGFSLVAGNPPSNAVDGNPATTYAGSSSFRDDASGKYSRHGYISIDLGRSYKIGKIVVHAGAVHYYRIVMSNASPYPAGSPWLFKDYAAQYGTATTSAEEFTFPVNGAYTARYLYILTGVQATPSSVAPQLKEIEVYEWLAGATPVPADISTSRSTTAPSAPTSAGLAGYWSLNEGSGSVAKDGSGNGNDGAISGATWAAGKFGNALNFDGNADFVKLPHTTVNGLNDITFAAWIRSSSNKDMGIITGANSATDNEFLLFIEGGTLSTTVKNQTFIAKKKINDGSWHFVTVVRTGNTGEVIVYVDGQQDAKSTLTAGKLVIDPNGLWIGRDQDCVGGCWQTEQDFQGSMDEAAIYNRALSQAEIQAVMAGGTVTPPLSTVPPATTTTPSVAPRPTDTTLQAEERTVSPNSATTVPIRLDKADKLGSLNFSLRYDASVLKVNRADSGDLAGGTLFQANIRDAGIIRFGIVAQGAMGITGDGPVAHVEFTALGARGAQSQISLGDLMATDTSGAKLGVTLRSGRVTIAAKLKGDYDGDGKVTAKDALAALKISVNELSEDLNLDMDADGKVTAEDARQILAGALGGGTPAVSQPAQPSQPTASLPVLPPLVSQVLQPSADAQAVSYQDQVGVLIPGGTLDGPQAVTISPAPNLPDHPFKGFTQLAAYDISIGNIKEFKKPLTIEIAYDPSKLPPNISPENALSVGWWDASKKVWVSAPFVVDTTRKVIMVPATHLTVWEVWAWGKGWELRPTEHFKIFFDPNAKVSIAGSRGTGIDSTQKLAAEAETILEQAYKAYDIAKFNMALTYVPNWVVTGAATAVATGGVGAVVRGGLTVTAGAILNKGAVAGGIIGAVAASEKVYVFLDPEGGPSASHNPATGNMTIPLLHNSYEQLRHDLSHELFHAVQNSYFTWEGMDLRKWWIEATADYAAAAIVSGEFKELPKVEPKYFQQPITTADGTHDYATSRFIQYLVTKGLNFKEMWDEVACLTCVRVLGTLEDYAAKRGKDLHSRFREFAEYVFFDSKGPIEIEVRKEKESYAARFNQRKTLKTTDTETSCILALPADYTAGLCEIEVQDNSDGSDRNLKVEVVGLMPPRDKFTVSAYINANAQSVPGDVSLKSLLYTGSQSAKVTVKKGQALYILVVNTGSQNQSLTVKVGNDEEGLTGDVTLVASPYNALSTNMLSVTGKWKLTAKGAQLEGKRDDDFTGIIVEAGVPVRLTVTAPASLKSTTWRDPGEVPLQYEIRTATGSPKLVANMGAQNVKEVSSTDTMVIDFTLPKGEYKTVGLYYRVTYKTDIYRSIDNAYRATLSDGVGGRPLVQTVSLLPNLRISAK